MLVPAHEALYSNFDKELGHFRRYTTENAKKIAKFLRDEGPKSIKTQIQGDELRVTSKSRDDLQTAIEQIKNGKFDFAVQFVNYR